MFLVFGSILECNENRKFSLIFCIFIIVSVSVSIIFILKTCMSVFSNILNSDALGFKSFRDYKIELNKISYRTLLFFLNCSFSCFLGQLRSKVTCFFRSKASELNLFCDLVRDLGVLRAERKQ